MEETKTKLEYDEDLLNEVRKWLESGHHKDGTDADCWVDKSLQYCVSLIDQLRDENESLWFMLDELKQSRWKKENSDELEKTINQHLATLKLMQMRKGEA